MSGILSHTRTRTKRTNFKREEVKALHTLLYYSDGWCFFFKNPLSHSVDKKLGAERVANEAAGHGPITIAEVERKARKVQWDLAQAEKKANMAAGFGEFTNAEVEKEVAAAHQIVSAGDLSAAKLIIKKGKKSKAKPRDKMNYMCLMTATTPVSTHACTFEKTVKRCSRPHACVQWLSIFLSVCIIVRATSTCITPRALSLTLAYTHASTRTHRTASTQHCCRAATTLPW